MYVCKPVFILLQIYTQQNIKFLLYSRKSLNNSCEYPDICTFLKVSVVKELQATSDVTVSVSLTAGADQFSGGPTKVLYSPPGKPTLLLLEGSGIKTNHGFFTPQALAS